MGTVTAPSHPPATAWAALDDPLFRRLWLSGVLASVGLVVSDVTAGWTMTGLTSSPLPVALLQSAASLPVLLFALPAGAIADIIDRRRWMIGILLILSLVGASMAVISHMGAWSPALLLAFVFLIGIGNALYTPASMRTVPDILEGPRVPLGVTLNSMAVNIARVVGASLGGWLLAQALPGAGFLVYALLVTTPVTVLAGWSGPRRTSHLPPEGIVSAMVSGTRYAWHSPGTRRVLIRTFLFVIFGGAVPALLPVIARRELHLDAWQFGLLTATFGAGALAGATVLTPLRRRLGLDLVLALMSVTLAAAALGLALIRDWLVLLPVLLCGGAAWVSIVASFGVATGAGSPPWVLSRLLSLYLLVFQGGAALSGLVWGTLAQSQSVSFALTTAAGGLVLGLVARWIWPMPAANPTRLEPSLHWPPPPVLAREETDRGPVQVSVEYQIDPARATEFLAAMRGVEQERLRDGAYQWHLLEDPDAPGVYVESFLLSSWLDHLRQHERVTREDQDVEAAARAFQVGPGPKVRHLVGLRR